MLKQKDQKEEGIKRLSQFENIINENLLNFQFRNENKNNIENIIKNIKQAVLMS